MEKVRIELKSHLEEYAIAKFPVVDDAVVIPSSMDIYFVLLDLLQKKGKGIEVCNDGIYFAIRNTGIGKDPRVYKYLSRHGRMLFETRLEVMFWIDFHDVMDREVIRGGKPCLEAAQIFVEKFRINSITEDALIKHYYRWRCNNRLMKTRSLVKQS